MSTEKGLATQRMARARMEEMLAPCFADPPTAGVVMVVNSPKGTEFFSMNMDTLELTHTLQNASEHMLSLMTEHTPPEKLQ